MALAVALATLVLSAQVAIGAPSQENPLGKVLELLDTLMAKVTAEGEKEAKAYKEYFDWCDDFSKSKGFEIKTLTMKRNKLEAEIAELTGSIEAADAEIEKLGAQIAMDETELRDATLIREKEAKEFAMNEADLMETINTLTRAIGILEKEMAKNPAAFAQMDTSSMDGVVKALTAVV